MNNSKPVIFLIIGFVIGLVAMYFYIQPKLVYQGKSVVDWAVTADKNANDNNQLKQDIQTMKAEVERMQSAPTPTPLIKYVTKPSNPTTCYTYNKGKSTEFIQCQ
jgi:predicted PurR-regulated permease PerM